MLTRNSRPGRTPQEWLTATAVAVAAFLTVEAVAVATEAVAWAFMLSAGVALVWWAIAVGVGSQRTLAREAGLAIAALTSLLMGMAMLGRGHVEGVQDQALTILTGWGVLAGCVGYCVAYVTLWREGRAAKKRA